jgi:hypothetical protein
LVYRLKISLMKKELGKREMYWICKHITKN